MRLWRLGAPWFCSTTAEARGAAGIYLQATEKRTGARSASVSEEDAVKAGKLLESSVASYKAAIDDRDASLLEYGRRNQVCAHGLLAALLLPTLTCDCLPPLQALIAERDSALFEVGCAPESAMCVL